MQEICLILLAVDCGTQSPGATVIRDGTTCIVPSGNGIAAEECAPLANECAELHRRIAANTGAWRFTALIRRHKRLKDGVGELLLEILNMERDAEVIGNATRIVGGVEGAAALAVTVALIRGTVESHPHTDYFMTCLNQECSSNRRVNAA
jgi:hypothetical protein